LPVFTRKAIAAWARTHLNSGSRVVSDDGLACFAVVSGAGCPHWVIVVGCRKPKDPPEFARVSKLRINVKTSLSAAAPTRLSVSSSTPGRDLGAIAYRLNRCVRLDTLPQRLLVTAVATGQRPEI
jgi:hypothetical protein